MLTIFQFFAAKTEASVLRMLEGSPHEYLHKPIMQLLERWGVQPIDSVGDHLVMIRKSIN